jgi:hypothetical protein
MALHALHKELRDCNVVLLCSAMKQLFADGIGLSIRAPAPYGIRSGIASL